MKSSIWRTHENCEGSISLTRRTRNSKKPSRMLVRNWKHQLLLLCLAKLWRRIVGVINPTKLKTRLACIPEADESTRLRVGESLPNHHEDHIAGKGNNSLQHNNLVHKFIPMPQAIKFQQQRQRWTRNGKNWRKFRRGTWQKSKVRNRWSMKQGQRALQFILHLKWTYGIWKMLNCRQSTKNTKVELYSERHCERWFWVLCSIHGTRIISMTNDSSRSHGYHSRLPGCDGQAADAVFACTEVKMKDTPKYYWKFQNRNVQTFGFVYHDKNCLNHGPVSKTQLLFLNGICTVILWQDYCVKGNLRKSYCSTVGKRFPIRNAFSYTVNKGLFLSGYVDDLKLAGKKQNVIPMWYSSRKSIWENQHLSLIMYTWCVLKDNAKQAKILWTITEPCSNREFPRVE